MKEFLDIVNKKSDDEIKNKDIETINDEIDEIVDNIKNDYLDNKKSTEN